MKIKIVKLSIYKNCIKFINNMIFKERNLFSKNLENNIKLAGPIIRLKIEKLAKKLCTKESGIKIIVKKFPKKNKV